MPYQGRDIDPVIGDWDGQAAATAEAARVGHALLLAEVRSAYLDLLADRERWALIETHDGRVRAVAYQSAASRVLRALDRAEAATTAATTAVTP